jgi:hypothetical protein
MPQDAARRWPPGMCPALSLTLPPEPDPGPWDAMNVGIVFLARASTRNGSRSDGLEGALRDGGERCRRYPTDERSMGRMSCEPSVSSILGDPFDTPVSSPGTLLTRLCHRRGPF